MHAFALVARYEYLCRCDEYISNVVQCSINKILTEMKEFGYTMETVLVNGLFHHF